MNDVLFRESAGLGHIVLNRPEKINSLTHHMVEAIDEKLKEWANHSGIKGILLYGNGEKGFCAGGDMKVYYENREKAGEVARKFFPPEYEMDLKIIRFPKPVIVWMDGIVMGGGVGISQGADVRLVTEKTKWAMPEVNIGFFPDVGASWFLNRISVPMARYISLLAKFLRAEDVLWLGYGEYKMERQSFSEIVGRLEQLALQREFTLEEIHSLMKEYQIPAAPGQLEKEEDRISRYFSPNTLEEIIEELEKGISQGDQWAKDALEELRQKSVLSQKIILEQLDRAKTLTVEEGFQLELTLSYHFMENPDFFEGLRSVLVDKEPPNWHYKTPEDVPRELVLSFFEKK